MVRYSSVRRRKCEPYVQYFENTVGIVVSLRIRQGRLLRRPCSLIPKYFSVLRHRPTRSISKSFLLPDKSRRDFQAGSLVELADVKRLRQSSRRLRGRGVSFYYEPWSL